MLVEPLTTSTGVFTVSCPADKSLTHRAIIFSACATGKSVIKNPLLGRDCLATVDAFRGLGVEIVVGEKIEVFSKGSKFFISPRRALDFQNSGTTARLLTGLLSSLEGLFCVCEGDDSLSSRPMRSVVDKLRLAGADIRGRNRGNNLPLVITGKKLRPMLHELEVASAQIKSALLLAAMHTAAGKVRIDLPAGTRDHTEEMLKQCGIDCIWDVKNARQRLTVSCPYELPARNWFMPADPSAAAFFVVLGVLMPAAVQFVINGVLANTGRLAFLQVIAMMGGRVEKKETGKGTCDLTVFGGSSLQAVTMRRGEAVSLIDEIVILAVLALFAKGKTAFHGLAQLRYKESDRLAKVAELINLAGGTGIIDGDALIVGGVSGRKIKPFRYDSAGDHRLAMAAAVCGLFAEGRCVIENSACVDVSFPGFFKELDKVAWQR